MWAPAPPRAPPPRYLATVESYQAQLEALRVADAEDYHILKIRLETDIQNLEQHLEAMRATYQLNTEKLEYNYRVLVERDHENQVGGGRGRARAQGGGWACLWATGARTRMGPAPCARALEGTPCSLGPAPTGHHQPAEAQDQPAARHPQQLEGQVRACAGAARQRRSRPHCPRVWRAARSCTRPARLQPQPRAVLAGQYALRQPCSEPAASLPPPLVGTWRQTASTWRRTCG